MIDAAGLRVMRAIAEEGSFTAAALALGYSQPAVSQMVKRLEQRTGTVLVFGQIEAGFAANAVPKTGRVSGTIRTQDIGTWRTLEPLMRELIDDVVAPTGCNYELSYTRGVPPVMNDDVATAALAGAAQNVDPHAVVQAPQSSGGEDFSWYLERVPGAMVRLGAWDGKGPKLDLHQGNLIIDERAIAVGVRLFGSIAQHFYAAADGADLPG